MSTHLFLALSRGGFGETILGVQVAQALSERGHHSTFLIHESSAKVLEQTSFDFVTIGSHLGPLLPVFVEEIVDKYQPASIVLSDFFTTDLWFLRHAVDRRFLRTAGVPLLAIDTWSVETTGPEIDIYWHRRRTFEDWTHELDGMIRPAPLAVAGNGGHVYSCLPRSRAVGSDVRSQLHERLALPHDAKLVLWCSAAWQQMRYGCAEAERISASLPRLLAQYFLRLGPDIHLLHVGPDAYDLPLGDRYHWLDQMTPDEFDTVVAGSDLLLTANISSTTIGKAMVLGVPVLALLNSVELETVGDLARLPFSLDEEDAGPWVADNVPFYRWHMWPVGYYSFLEPLLDGGAYVDAISRAEVLDRKAVLAGIDALLRDPKHFQAALDRQQNYVAGLAALPAVADLVLAIVDAA